MLNMAGWRRVPDALRRADTLARTRVPGVSQTNHYPSNQHAHRGYLCDRSRVR
jgi:hypothetical protein